MGVRKRKNGTWMVDVRWKGRRYRERSPVDTKAGAQAYELLLRNTLARDGNLDALNPAEQEEVVPMPTFAEFVERWMVEYVEVKNSRSEQWSKASILRCHLLPSLGAMRLSEIDALVVDRLVLDLHRKRLKAKTINNVLTVLRRALRSAVRWRLLNGIPEIHFERSARPPFRFLTESEAARLVRAAPAGTLRAMVLTALHTGMRLSELLGLHWSEVNLDAGIITVRRAMVGGHLKTTKTEHWRTVPIGATLLSELSCLAQTSTFVFDRPALRRPEMYALRRLHKISQAADISPAVGWHALRHTWATTAVGAGVTLDAVRAVLGHTDIRMTLQYAHFDARRLSGIAAAVDAKLGNCGHRVVTDLAESDSSNRKIALLSDSPWSG